MTTHASQRTGHEILLIDDGSLPALAALACVQEPRTCVLWHPAGDDPAAHRRRAVAEAHAKIAGQRLLLGSAGRTGLRGAPPPTDLAMVAVAVSTAHLAGCRTVVWPKAVGPDPARFGPVVDLSVLLAEASLSDGADAMRVEIPFADLEPDQILDIADDAGAPLALFWPCEVGDEHPCLRCDGCTRWRGAFETRGLAWPFSAAGVAGGQPAAGV
ncbi:MAG: 7-cyano-7-deazaguanine synthase [Phycisphaeraceae bacterium]|nr:7-cyano-7-deazaguanine synthase [Phycisphaeraceae bacterium]